MPYVLQIFSIYSDKDGDLLINDMSDMRWFGSPEEGVIDFRMRLGNCDLFIGKGTCFDARTLLEAEDTKELVFERGIRRYVG